MKRARSSKKIIKQEDSLIEAISQADLREIKEIFCEYVRGSIRETFVNLMHKEVLELCGDFYKPDKSSRFCRGGSAVGYMRLGGKKEKIIRPRVYEKGKGEKRLKSYECGKLCEEVREQILRLLEAGVSSREVERIYLDMGFSSSTSVSRLWVKEGLKYIERIRDRELSGEEFFCLMLDGVSLSEDLTAIVSLGITRDGRKMMLDFEIGSSENEEVCKRLIVRLKKRGFKEMEGTRLIVVLDGSQALEKSVLKNFANPVIQRCQIHKEKNIRNCLSKRYHSELKELFRELRESEGAKAAREAYRNIEDFLKERSERGLKSLYEAGESLIRVQVLGCPSSLYSSLLNTNLIENSINNIRRKIGRVKRWRAETDQAERWIAYGMCEAERGFHRIKGYRDIEKCLEKVKRI